MAGHNQENSGIISGINVTPLVDIVLVLLIVFMVTAKVMVAPAVPMDLPKASTGEGTQVVFSVLLPKDGRTLVNGAAVAGDDQLTSLAHAALENDREVRAVINADGDVPHRKVIHVLDLLKKAGLARVAFGTQGDTAP